MVMEGWAPQAKILGHSSTSGFERQCGWNSIMQSMKFGVPIVAMPMHIDQPLNARMVEEVVCGSGGCEGQKWNVSQRRNCMSDKK
ncbi:unnamed protein product, partial [Ilex paraguariensis]